MLLLIMAMVKPRPYIKLGLPTLARVCSVPIMGPWVMGPIVGTHVPGFQHTLSEHFVLASVGVISWMRVVNLSEYAIKLPPAVMQTRFGSSFAV